MDTQVQKLKSRLPLFDSLGAESEPLWGIMSAQNMIEHLGGVLYGTAKGMGQDVIISPEKSAQAKAYFFNTYHPFPRNVRMPGTEHTPPAKPPLRYKSFEEALGKLESATQLFIDQLHNQPNQTASHGYFGALTMQEWLTFHIKHFEHHLMQFGVLPWDEKITHIEKLLHKVNKVITSDTVAQWGQMNAQQMIEHLGLVFIVSTGKFKLAYQGTDEDAKRYWDGFLQSDNPWKEVFPQISIGDPRPPRFDAIEASKDSLLKSFHKYLAYCEEQPDAINSHFYLGNLSVDQWRQVHVKHIKHHLRQFGVDV